MNIKLKLKTLIKELENKSFWLKKQMRSGHCKIEYRKRKAAQANFKRNKGLLVSDDLPQRRKSTLEFILLSVIHASEHLLIVFRDLSEEEGKERKQPYTWRQIFNSSRRTFQITHAAFSPFLELLICFTREYIFPCQIPLSGENLNKGTIVIDGNV